jgi:hypothetical protein
MIWLNKTAAWAEIQILQEWHLRLSYNNAHSLKKEGWSSN